jgi:hypothetical protein
MTVITFDTHNAIKRLIQVGYKEVQAEAFIKIMQESRELDFSNLVTKSDLKAEISEVRAEISAVRAEIAALKFELLKWLIPFLLGIILAIFLK